MPAIPSRQLIDPSENIVAKTTSCVEIHATAWVCTGCRRNTQATNHARAEGAADAPGSSSPPWSFQNLIECVLDTLQPPATVLIRRTPLRGHEL
jgi:hypothetical protein